MRLFFLFIVCCMHLNQVLSRTELNYEDDRNEAMNTKIVFDDVIENRMSILDLNTDCLFMIFDKLSTVKLLNLSEVQPFTPIVELVLKNRFSKIKVTLGGHSRFKFNSTGKSRFDGIIEDKNGSIMIDPFQTAVTILTKYGHLIGKLWLRKFDTHWPEDGVRQIYTLINAYCSQTVKSVSFSYSEEYIFDELTAPFKMAERVDLVRDNGYPAVSDSEYTFSRMFPAVRHLTIKSYNITNFNANDYVMPHLESIHSQFKIGAIENLNETLFGQILKTNPQISTIIVRICDINKLKFLSNEARNLVDFKIDYYSNSFGNIVYDYYIMDDDECSNLRFDKLKKLRVDGYELPPRFICDNLEEFTCESEQFEPELLINFIANRPSLKKFKFKKYLRSPDILLLATKRLTVTEAQFNLSLRDISADSIVQFIKSSPNLRKLQFGPSDLLTMKLGNILSGLLQDEWTVKRENGILLERKY